ncbi:putative flavanone 3-dioxygenase [Dioscorea sansibarensis]
MSSLQLACPLSSQQQGICMLWTDDQSNVPVIDISKLHGPQRSTVVDDIQENFRRKGFFQVINHGISQHVTEGALHAAQSFFELPANEKMKLASDDIAKPVRYGYSKDGHDCAHRFFLKHYSSPLEQWIHLWPSIPPEYRYLMGRYAEQVKRIVVDVTEVIVESLGLKNTELGNKMKDGVQLMTVNSYPAGKKEGVVISMPPHTDYSFITVLLQSFEGLEEWDTTTNTWNMVPNIPGSLLVHGGNFLEVLTNGRYKSAVHRVASHPDKMRFSIASLHSLAMDEKVAVADELVDEQHPRGYRDCSFKDFLGYLTSGNATLGQGKEYLDTLKIQ